MPLSAEIADSAESLARHRPAWDRLAEELEQPWSAPGWLMAWWAHAAPPDARLRCVVGTELGELVGVAPFYTEHRRGLVRYALLASAVTARVEPLARDGQIEEVAAAVANELAQADPSPASIRFDSIAAGSPWPELLAGSWPRRGSTKVRVERTVSAPAVSLDDPDFDTWMAARSRNFRQQMRRGRRQLEERGARFRTPTAPEDLDRDVTELARLHRARWDSRGGSAALQPGVEEMLRAAARELVPQGALRIEAIDLDGQVVSAHLFLTAGGEATYWLGGFDDSLAAQRPAMLSLVAAVEHAFADGRRRLDLGPGEHDYKYRLADREEELRTVVLVPPSPRSPLARLELAASAGRSRLARLRR